MRPELAKREYFVWTCRNKKHNHRTKATAEACLSRSTGKAYPRWTVAQELALAVALLEGEAVTRLAKKYSRSATAVSCRFRRALRTARKEVEGKVPMPLDVDDYSVAGARKNKQFWLSALSLAALLPRRGAQ